MPSIFNSGSRVQSADQLIAALASMRSRRRQFLLATVFTTGLFATLGLSTDQASAKNECGLVGPGAFPIACGQNGPGPAPWVSIVYNNADTAPATSTTFVFSDTQAVGGGAGDRNAVFLSSNEVGHSITVEVQKFTTTPSFVATNGLGNSQAFWVTTQGNTSPIVFNVEDGVFTGGNGAAGRAVELSTSGTSSGISGTFAGTYTAGTSLLRRA